MGLGFRVWVCVCMCVCMHVRVCVRERESERESQRERESLVGTTRYRVQGKGVRGARGVANVLLMCC